MSLSVKNINKPSPLWFRKLKRVTSLLSDTAVVFLLAMGYADSSLPILISRVGISALMNTIDVLISDKLDDDNN